MCGSSGTISVSSARRTPLVDPGKENTTVVPIVPAQARLNIAALVIFAISFFLRTGSYSELVGRKLTVPFLLSLVGMILISISGWLGGELAFRYGVGQTGNEENI